MNIDPIELANIIEGMVNRAVDSNANRTYKRGIIDTINGQRANVFIEGNTVATPNIISLQHYTPVVGHKVMVVSIGETGANLFIIGRIPV